MKDDVISFEKKLTYKWKYIQIDYFAGYPILLNGKEIGGFLIRTEKLAYGDLCFFEGIELDPEYRGKGIGTMVINMLKEQCVLILGSITEDEPKPFWKSVGAEFRPIPRENFPARYQASIHTDSPVFFFITENEKAREMAETYAKEVPELIKKQI